MNTSENNTSISLPNVPLTFEYTFDVPLYHIGVIQTDYKYCAGTANQFSPEERAGCAATLELIKHFGGSFNEGLLEACANVLPYWAVGDFLAEWAWRPILEDEESTAQVDQHFVECTLSSMKTENELKTLMELFDFVQGRPEFTPAVIRTFSLLSRGERAESVLCAVDKHIKEVARNRAYEARKEFGHN